MKSSSSYAEAAKMPAKVLTGSNQVLVHPPLLGQDKGKQIAHEKPLAIQIVR